MSRTLALFGFAALLAGCGGATRPVKIAAAPPTAAARPLATTPTPGSVVPTGCRAEPATVYGDEPVVFHIQARGTAPVPLQLIDQAARPFAQAQEVVPGRWQPPSVPSGDFTLKVGGTQVSCTVTVNRELSRASQDAR